MKVLDLHCDTIGELFKNKEKNLPHSLLKNDLQLDLTRLKEGDYCLQNFALFTNLTARPHPFEYCMKLVDLYYAELERYPDLITPVTSYAEIEKNSSQGRMSALLTMEEGAACQGELSFLRNFYRLGVRMMTLTWNYKNELAYPNHIYIKGSQAIFQPDTEHGLTETGIQFVEEMERLGMIIDVSHLSDAGIEDVFRYTTKPFVASHSNARTVAKNPRNLTDDMIRRLSDRGGVAGINYCADFLYDWTGKDRPIAKIDHIITHMNHMKKTGGIGCIALGSDFDGIECDLEMKSPADLPLLEQAMGRSGFTEGEIEAVFYKNALRVYKEILH